MHPRAALVRSVCAHTGEQGFQGALAQKPERTKNAWCAAEDKCGWHKMIQTLHAD